MNKKVLCVLDENKICDDCGECNRCDLDPNKICDNCCKCIAMEDEGNEFRSRTITREGIEGLPKRDVAPLYKKAVPKRPKMNEWEPGDEPTELTPELLDYWEKVLIEHGEAPADDGLGEIDVLVHNPVHGQRKIPAKRRQK
jgi:hypothetical protein